MIGEPRDLSEREAQASGSDATRTGMTAPPQHSSEDRATPHPQSQVRQAIRQELAFDAPDELVRVARLEEQGDRTSVIELEHVSLSFDHPVLEDISFVAHARETVVILGESGTGKSTILKLILRLLVPDSGRVLVGGECINDLSFEEALRIRRKMGMVFQGAALFDSMTVHDNVAYPLREHTDLDEEEIEARVREKLRFVDLDPDRVMWQYPAELSGGMKKRHHAVRRADVRARPADDRHDHAAHHEAAARARRDQRGRLARHPAHLQNGDEGRAARRAAHQVLRHAGGDDGQRRLVHPRFPEWLLMRRTVRDFTGARL
jgi:ABC-type glutathione transport system ATPase component